MTRILRFSTRGFLLFATLAAITLASVRNGYLHDIALVERLGPTSRTLPAGSSWIWIREHTVVETQWMGPSILEIPMRNLHIPWFDRVVAVTVFHDDHVTHDAALALAEIPNLTSLTVRNPTKDKAWFDDLAKTTNGRVNVAFEHHP